MNKYKEYIKSEKWLQIRLDVIQTRGNCERCGSKNKLQVHHKTYKNLFKEEPEDLELLCYGCHMTEHKLIDKQKHHKKIKSKKKSPNKKQSKIRKEMEKSRRYQDFHLKYS